MQPATKAYPYPQLDLAAGKVPSVVEEFVDIAHRWGDWDSALSKMKGALSHKPYMDRALANRLAGPPLVKGW